VKRSGILNAQLARALAELGHTHLVVIGDCGLPRPDGVEVVDLAVTFGLPAFEEILAVVADEIVIEGAVAASEASSANSRVVEAIRGVSPEVKLIPHEEFKALSSRARVFIRTGEASPYANVILRCGVPF
jgi:D-ribose pyranase